MHAVEDAQVVHRGRETSVSRKRYCCRGHESLFAPNLEDTGGHEAEALPLLVLLMFIFVLWFVTCRNIRDQYLQACVCACACACVGLGVPQYGSVPSYVNMHASIESAVCKSGWVPDGQQLLALLV